MKLSNYWETTYSPPTTNHHRNIKLHDGTDIEQKTLKTKVIALYKETQKQYLNPTPTQKNSQIGPKKVKNHPKIKSKCKVRIKGTIENMIYQLQNRF